MKQTAVEYLIKELKETLNLKHALETDLAQTIIEEAKDIEKNQIAEGWNDGNLLGRNGNVILDYDNGKTYYNRNYIK